jgi:methylmalonyl-CoA mutase N-terminal domain/subunit
VELHEYDAKSAERQIKSLRALKRERNKTEVTRTLKELEKVARLGTNIMPCLVDCRKVYATMGEMAKVFRNVYGEFKEPSIF